MVKLITDLKLMTNMVLNEGRKDDIFNKFKKDIEGERQFTSKIFDETPVSGYDFFIDNDFVKKTNYKYLNFLLTLYYLSNSTKGISDSNVNGYVNSAMKDANELVKKVELFERFPKSFSKTDINQYLNSVEDRVLFLNEFNEVLKKIESREEEERNKKQSKKIYEDNQYLIVKPLSTTASCYYGKSTRWCTAAKKDNQFANYAYRGDLYYVIDKTIAKEYEHLSKYAVFHDKATNNVKVYDSNDILMEYYELPKKVQEILTPIITSNEGTQVENVLRWIAGFNRSSGVYKGAKLSVKDILMTSTPEVNFVFNEDVNVKVKFIIDKEKINSDFKSVVLPYKIIVNGDEYSGTLNVVGEIMNLRHSYFIDKLFNTVNKYLDTDIAYWTPMNRQSKYSFTRPEGTIAEKFTNYIINSNKKNKLPTKKEFLEKLFKEKGRNIKDINIQGYFSLFFASLKDAGIVELKRNTTGTPRFYYTLGYNYDKWKQGKLKRV